MAEQKIITTKTGRQKIATAHRDGIILPQLTKMGWGDGGVDGEGNVLQPSDEAIAVPGEFAQTDITGYTLLTEPDIKLVMVSEVDGSLIGETKDLSSVGLYDAENDLIAIINFEVKLLETDISFEAEWEAEY